MGCMPPAFAIATRLPNSSASAKSAPAASSCAPSPHVPSRRVTSGLMAAIARLGSSAAGVFLLPVARRASAADACCLPRLSPLLSSVTSGSRTPSSTILSPFFFRLARDASAAAANCRAATSILLTFAVPSSSSSSVASMVSSPPLTMSINGVMAPLSPKASCVLGFLSARREMAAAACWRADDSSLVSAATIGSMTPSSSRVFWLSGLMERERDHKAKRLAPSEPSLSKPIKSSNGPAIAISCCDVGFSCTSFSSSAVAFAFAMALPLERQPTSNVVICLWLVTFPAPREARA